MGRPTLETRAWGTRKGERRGTSQRARSSALQNNGDAKDGVPAGLPVESGPKNRRRPRKCRRKDRRYKRRAECKASYFRKFNRVFCRGPGGESGHFIDNARWKGQTGSGSHRVPAPYHSLKFPRTSRRVKDDTTSEAIRLATFRTTNATVLQM